MTTPPLHNTDEARVVEIIRGLRLSGINDMPKNALTDPEARSAILSLLAEARTTERKSFESIVFQACDAANLSKPDKRDVMKFVTEALRQKESK